MFTFYFKQSGAARKHFVKAVSEVLEAEPKYLGMPSAAYEIDVVRITKEGNIEVDERTDSELVENLINRLAERGYEAEPMEDAGKEVPAEGDSADAFSMTISVARSIMTDSGIENLKKLVLAKSGLLKQAFGIEDTEIVVSEQGISFPWFGRLEPEELKLTTQFISGLCKFANASKRVTSRPRQEDNPKFAMRVWMVRMGFGGAEYKDLRRYMLRHLPGDAAFRYGRRDPDGHSNGCIS